MTPIALSTPHASIKNVRILVLRVTHVHKTPNAEFLTTDLCATVPQDGVEIRKRCATNVRNWIKIFLINSNKLLKF